MKNHTEPVLSVIVPMYNEAAGIAHFHHELTEALQDTALDYEILYVDDGSHDGTADRIREFRTAGTRIRLLRLSRNFGKEIATTAGIHAAHGDAILTIDADGQHPVAAIAQFIVKWQHGAKVVIGRPTDRQTSFAKRFGSRLFNGVFRRITGMTMDPGATDFRLIDKQVQMEFNRMTEHNRITRGLIDWLGYERAYVSYAENPRFAGTATYSFRKLFKLAIDSAISLSTSPLHLVAYIGAVVLPVATVLGLGMAMNYLLQDPLHLHATGGAYLTVLLLWLVGILLVSQGIIGLYLAHIHSETQNRPLYILDDDSSEQSP